MLVFCSRKTFYLLKYCDAYTGPINLVPLLGGKNIDFCPPLPYLWLSARADHLIHWIQMTSCFTKQLLPGNWHYRWREQLLPEQLITRNLWYRSIISLHVHHAYLNIAQNIWVYSTLTHRVGGLGFFQFRASPLTPWLGWIVLKISRILPPNFCAFSAANVGTFFKCRLFL